MNFTISVSVLSMYLICSKKLYLHVLDSASDLLVRLENVCIKMYHQNFHGVKYNRRVTQQTSETWGFWCNWQQLRANNRQQTFTQSKGVSMLKILFWLESLREKATPDFLTFSPPHTWPIAALSVCRFWKVYKKCWMQHGWRALLTLFDYPTSIWLKHTGYSDFTQVKLCHYLSFYFIEVKHLECEWITQAIIK